MDIKEIKYIVWKYVVDFPLELKFEIQQFFRGYSDRDVWYLGDYIVDKLHKPLKKFVLNQAEHGMALPLEFQTDPAKWLEILQKIEFAVNHEWNIEHDSDYNPTKRLSLKEAKEFEDRVDEGFALLGKHLRDLWD